MKILLKAMNWLGYIFGCSVLGNLFAKLYWSLFKFASDVDYAEKHPKMYLLKFFVVLVLWIVLALALIWYPLTKLMGWISRKIDVHFDKKDDEEDDDFLN